MVTEEMLREAIENPEKSRHHEWQEGEQEQYDFLRARGRGLYDNLRTKFDVSHAEAYDTALFKYGTGPGPFVPHDARGVTIERKVTWAVEAYDNDKGYWVPYITDLASGQAAYEVEKNVRRDVPFRDFRTVRTYTSRFVENI